jgi:hypothetical protein
MSEAIQEEVIVGREPTVEEQELIDWANEAIRKGPTLVNEGLRQLITLDTALLGGSAALMGQGFLPAPTACKALGVLFLLGSLWMALAGSLPRESLVNVNHIEALRTARGRTIKRKMHYLRWSGRLLVIAFAIVLGGLLATMG